MKNVIFLWWFLIPGAAMFFGAIGAAIGGAVGAS